MIRRLAECGAQQPFNWRLWQHNAGGRRRGGCERWTGSPSRGTWPPLGLIVEEAGGKASTVDGERTIYKGRFVSTNGLLHEEVLKIFR